jgi:hypothetical protein
LIRRGVALGRTYFRTQLGHTTAVDRYGRSDGWLDEWNSFPLKSAPAALSDAIDNPKLQGPLTKPSGKVRAPLMHYDDHSGFFLVEIDASGT